MMGPWEFVWLRGFGKAACYKVLAGWQLVACGFEGVVLTVFVQLKREWAWAMSFFVSAVSRVVRLHALALRRRRRGSWIGWDGDTNRMRSVDLALLPARCVF
jgi:hypothetical protein